ncbi:MAG: fasciclin domain-containing protein [Bacteroidia bacterium]|nr:fasciclin domain-containing protein [Bacteroidia bacterium]MDW8332936.1 fasciclin domain-containing protein [Bacteroidia bacterium]
MKIYGIVALTLALTTAACGGGKESNKTTSQATDTTPAPPPPPPLPKLAERLVQTDSLRVFGEAVAKAGLIDGEGKSFTVFAPVNRSLPKNANLDRGLLALHVVEGRLFSDDVLTQKSLKTLSGKEVKIEVEGKVIKINGVRIVEADVKAENGVIHALDAPLKVRP